MGRGRDPPGSALSDARTRGFEREGADARVLAARVRAGELSQASLRLLGLLGDPAARVTLGAGPPARDLDAWALELDALGTEVALRAHVAVGSALLDACGSGRHDVERVLGYAMGWVEAESLPAQRRTESRWISERAMLEQALRPPPATPVARWVVRAREVIEGGWAQLLVEAPREVREQARGVVEHALRDLASGA